MMPEVLHVCPHKSSPMSYYLASDYKMAVDVRYLRYDLHVSEVKKLRDVLEKAREAMKTCEEGTGFGDLDYFNADKVYEALKEIDNVLRSE